MTKTLSEIYLERHANFQMERVIVAGIGGTGSFIADGLCRLVPEKCQIMLVDPDVIEEKNLRRQDFHREDVGRFKAEAVAHRLARKYRRAIDYSCVEFNAISHVGENRYSGYSKTGPLIIGCVDNWLARQAIALANHTWWLDAGNGEQTGQILFGLMRDKGELKGECSYDAVPFPAPSLQLPALLAPAPPEETDCEDVEDQAPLINRLMATIALEFVNRILHQRATWLGMYLDLERGVLNPVPATLENIAKITGLTKRQLTGK